MSKHTPGPWEIEKVSGGWGVRAPNWGYVAIHNTSGLPHWDEGQEANRLLIAAAPELLEALVHMVQWHGKREWPAASFEVEGLLPIDLQNDDVQKAMRAIAKATGES